MLQVRQILRASGDFFRGDEAIQVDHSTCKVTEVRGDGFRRDLFVRRNIRQFAEDVENSPIGYEVDVLEADPTGGIIVERKLMGVRAESEVRMEISKGIDDTVEIWAN